MTVLDSSANLYTDFSGFAGMRADARDGAAGATDRVARQFEALFVQMMLKSMRDATLDSGLFGGSTKMYQDMFDSQISMELTADRGIGLAEMIARQIEGATPIVRGGQPLYVRRTDPADAASAAGEAGALAQPARGGAVKSQAFESPHDFVRSLLPHARDAGEALGVDPKILLAQAALETGWGKYVMADGSGRSANNFFGIKADARWNGPRVQVSTLESLGGVLERVRADFRAYASPAESFQDYVRFISGHGRYASALDAADDPATYVRSLQEAGYATDPRYAEKILDIFGRSELGAAIGGLDAGAIIREVF